MSQLMTNNSLPFIYKTPDRPIQKVEPKAPERPLRSDEELLATLETGSRHVKNESYKIYKSDDQNLPQISFVNKFFEKIKDEQVAHPLDEQNNIDKNELTTKTGVPTTHLFKEQSSQKQSEWITVDNRKKHYRYPKYDVYVKQKHYCGDYDCKGDCGVLRCGCIDVCRHRCLESF